MYPVAITSMLQGTATAGGNGVSAGAHSIGQWTDGGISNSPGGLDQFSLHHATDGSFNFDMGGQHLSGMKDMISGPFTKSFSIYQPGSGIAGHITVDQLTESITTSGLGTKLGTSLATAMKSAGVI